MVTEERLIKAVTSLYQHILKTHWQNNAVIGPDPGIRFNARIGRFIKGYLGFMPWSDNMAYAQAQKYWVLDNWLMVDLGLIPTQEGKKVAAACSERLRNVQTPEGYWEYPNLEWRGRIQTVEGNYAAMALLETYSRTRTDNLLEGARMWYDYAVEHIGFQEVDGGLAINYFGNIPGERVPNNAASTLRIFAQLAKETQNDQYLEYCPGMIKFLKDVQLENGLLPYAVANPNIPSHEDRIHFLCYNYNSFQFLNILDYFKFTNDDSVMPILDGLARFVSTGITDQGAAWYNSHKQNPEVLYYAAAAAATLSQATELGLGDYKNLANRAYTHVLNQQKPNGNMAYYSRNNYKLLQDRRSYPRYLSMILYHLLLEIKRVRQSNETDLLSQNQPVMKETVNA
ncbi:MAG: hypothetical protein AAF629_20255 [Chloroflexota bacterium]